MGTYKQQLVYIEICQVLTVEAAKTKIIEEETLLYFSANFNVQFSYM
jgi:hypothetical protein